MKEKYLPNNFQILKMLAKRIIPCLDIKDGRTVKGVNFIDLRDAGNPVELAEKYCKQGADELVFLDITATLEKRKTFYQLVRRLAAIVDIPFAVGGGISDLHDIEILLNNGADKVCINSAAFNNPELISKAAGHFGSQCILVAIDAKQHDDDEWYVYLKGGTYATGTKVLDWAKNAEDLGAGEILLTSMSNDGTKKGFALHLTALISSSLSIPVIASGGAGKLEDFYDVFTMGKADAALAAGIFHFGEVSIPQLKMFLKNQHIPIR